MYGGGYRYGPVQVKLKGLGFRDNTDTDDIVEKQAHM